MKNDQDGRRSREEEYLLDKYTSSLLEVYLSHYRSRGDLKGLPPLHAWIRSTIHRDAFGMSMIRARLNKQPHRPTEVAKNIGVSRQSVYAMIEDCAPQGWIRVHEEEQEEGATTNNGKPVLRYDANDELMGLARALVLRHIDFTEVSCLNSDWDNLMAYYKAQEALDKLPDKSRKSA